MKTESKRKAIVDMELSNFEIPPSGDVLVLGKRCPIGLEAAKRMLDAVSSDQFEVIQLNDDIIEAIACRKKLFLMAERESLIQAIIEEAKSMMGTECMIRIKCDVTISVKRVL